METGAISGAGISVPPVPVPVPVAVLALSLCLLMIFYGVRLVSGDLPILLR
ncbi:MAG TPA: hypothetical protein VF062_19165 [Candidatus Limnocylindrales bacterium]